MIKTISALFILTAVLTTGSSFYKQGGLKESIKRGQEVYTSYCMSCHMEDGNGTPDINPPLAKADYLKKQTPKTLINIILEGQSAEITVNKKKYSIPMPPQPYLADEQIADVLNYIRNSWGNKIPGTITPAQVKALRQ